LALQHSQPVLKKLGFSFSPFTDFLFDNDLNDSPYHRCCRTYPASSRPWKPWMVSEHPRPLALQQRFRVLRAVALPTRPPPPVRGVLEHKPVHKRLEL